MKISRAIALTVALTLPTSVVFAQGRAGSASPGQLAYNDGMNALNGDDFAAAEQKLQEAIQLDPALIDAYWHLASIYYRSKKYTKAVELLRRCPDKANLDVKQQLALNLYKTATPPPAESVQLLEQVTAARPEYFAAQVQLGQHFYKSDPKRGAAALEKFLKHRPQDQSPLDESVRFLLGTAYIEGKEWDSAVHEFELLSRQKPNDLGTKLMLGASLTGKGLKGDLKACSQAIALLERVHGEATKQPSIYYNLGSCYLKVNRSGDAEKEAAQYTKVKSIDAKGHVLLGDAIFAQRRYDKALVAYQAARALDRNNIGTLTKVGLTDVELGNYDAAVTELEQAEAQSASDVEVLCALTRAYAKKSARDKLLVKADKLAAIHEPRPQLCAGQAYFAHGSDEKATNAFQEVLREDPNSGAAKGQLVKVLNRRASGAVEKNDLVRAQALLGDAVKLQPDDLVTNRNLGLTLVMAKKNVEAAEVLQRVLKKLGKPDLIANRLLGRALVAEGKKEQARTEYEKAAQIALKVRGVDLAGVYTELGPLYLDAGNADQAVTVLEQAVKEGAGSPVAPSAQRNLTLALMARAVERLKDAKGSDGALEDVNRAAQLGKTTLSAKELVVVLCYEGVAALKAGRFQEATEAFRRASTSGGCPVKATYEKLGTSFLLAYAGYRDAGSPRGREEATRVFAQQLQKAVGATADLLRQLLRSDWELLGYDYYAKSDSKRAEAALRSAQKVPGKGERRELDHNLAVMDLVAGRIGPAEKAFDTLSGRPPESMVNLGIIRDRQGDGRGALQLYKRAWERGVRAGKLKDWIDVKERLWGAGGGT